MKKIISLVACATITATIISPISYTFADEASSKINSSMTQKVKKEIKDLSPWKGFWNNLGYYYGMDELSKELEELAKAKGMTKEDLMKEYETKFKTDFKSMEIKEDGTITFYEDVSKDGKNESKKIYEGKYKLDGEKTIQSHGHDVTLYVFKSMDDNAPIKELALMEGHGNLMYHVHFKYSKDKSIEEVIKDNNWWPTVVKEDISVEMIKASLKNSIEKAQNKKKEVKAEDIKDLKIWEGKWNNMALFLDDENLKESFDKLAKKEGISQEEAIKKYKEKRKSDFGSVSIEENTITFYEGKVEDAKGEISKGKYKFNSLIVDEKNKRNFLVFSSEDAKEEYKNLLLMVPHGEGLKHFHFRYGKESAEELLKKDGWYPTAIDKDATLDQLKGEIEE